tara:strand:+ start:688 stop:813 length:126 start_codon:yes stop_codon:yes gene_type:complete
MIKTLLPDRWRMIVLRRIVNNIKRKAFDRWFKAVSSEWDIL